MRNRTMVLAATMAFALVACDNQTTSDLQGVLPLFQLTVAKTGSGRIVSSPPGIDCGAVCTGTFVQGTVVTLTATPATDSQFDGWTSACAGTGNCTLTVTGTRSVSAGFSLLPLSTASVVDAEGNPQSQVSTTDPVQMSVAGLDPNERVAIVVTDPDGNEISPPGGYSIQADEEGIVPNSTVVQNLDLTTTVAKASGEPGQLVRKAVRIGRYNIQIRRPGGSVVGNTSFDVTDSSRLFCADQTGAAQGSFTSADTVYVRIERAGGNLADGTYDLYLLSDLNAIARNGDSLGGTRYDAVVANGTALVELGSFNGGVFDVVLDVNDNGSYEPDVDIISRRPRHNPCFTIQQARSETPVPIIGQICADVQGNYRDVFDPTIGDRDNRDMFAYITPNRRPRGGDVLAVRKYVVAHKDEWLQGDALEDVTAGFEVDPVQGFCTNEAPWLVWPRQLYVPGCYDVIIDVNRNAVYDVGVDFLDNIDNRGATTCGCVVADAGCADRITITEPAGGTTVEATTAQLSGTVTGAPTRGYATILRGAQSNRVDLNTDSSGAFDGRVPLFRGENLITVTFEYADGTACSVSTTVTSDPPAASTLFRAQLTWDEVADPDIHLVRPPGTDYQNGGGGTNDCNFGNCVVGFEGTGSNSIDWGLPGEDDDPKQDTDCVRCSSPIENIFMNQTNEDGDYVVYVDQYSGTSTNTVSIFIRDVMVGQVACGTMVSGSGTDSCRVGTIRWSGGTGGTGIFIPDGALAADFAAGQAAAAKAYRPLSGLKKTAPN